MKPVFTHWAEITARIRAVGSVFLALDYDGVLAPIAPQPDLAVLPAGTRSLLDQLSRCANANISIISGRALADVKRHVQVESIVYAGNHGAEIDHNNKVESHVGVPEVRDDLIRVRDQLTAEFAGMPGALVEDKGFGVGVHYREVPPPLLNSFHNRMNALAKMLPPNLEVVRAKKMIEVRPRVAWNKGNAVLHIWNFLAPGSLPICLGDDLTDEDGFMALRGKGINIYVGEERNSYAEYILASPVEVAEFLESLLNELKRTDTIFTPASSVQTPA